VGQVLAEYVADNEAARDRLFALVDALSDEDLAAEVEPGWRVSALLAHLAYWDRRYVLMLARAKEDRLEPPDLPEWLTDVENDALRAEWDAIPGREAVRLVREAVDAINVEVANLPNELAVDLTSRGQIHLMRRSRHRYEHIEQIEAVPRR